MKNYIIEFSGILKDGRRTSIRQNSFRCLPTQINENCNRIIKNGKIENETFITASLYEKITDKEFNFND